MIYCDHDTIWKEFIILHAELSLFTWPSFVCWTVFSNLNIFNSGG